MGLNVLIHKSNMFTRLFFVLYFDAVPLKPCGANRCRKKNGNKKMDNVEHAKSLISAGTSILMCINVKMLLQRSRKILNIH